MDKYFFFIYDDSGRDSMFPAADCFFPFYVFFPTAFFGFMWGCCFFFFYLLLFIYSI